MESLLILGKKVKNMSASKFVHVVNFWLKKDVSQSEIQLFEEHLLNLKGIETLTEFNVGKPAATDRPVIDRSYSYCLLTVFADSNGHDVYQTHALHLRFLEKCKTMWDKVLVYDSVSI